MGQTREKSVTFSCDPRSFECCLFLQLLRHDGRRAELASKEAAFLATAAFDEAIWVASVAEQLKQHTVRLRGLDIGDRSATTEAENMVNSLDKDLLSSKEDHLRKLKALEQQQSKLVTRMQVCGALICRGRSAGLSGIDRRASG